MRTDVCTWECPRTLARKCKGVCGIVTGFACCLASYSVHSLTANAGICASPSVHSWAEG